MSLKELKRLAPWQWESKVATKKHKIGPKGLQEWEQIQRAIVGADCDADGCGGSGGPRDKSGGSKRLRNKDAQSAAVPPSPDASALDLTTPGHPTTKKRSPQQAASNTTAASAAADLDRSADKAPEALPCPSTALKRDTIVAKTPAGTTSKTPAAVRLGVQTPALAILGKAFSPSPYAPTPVPYGGLKACSSMPAAAAAAQPRMTRTHSSSTSGSAYCAADAAAPADAAGSAAGNPGSSNARLAASSDAAAATAARVAAPGSSRSGGARATAGLTSGTPVPKFSLTSPAMLPPASKPLNTSGTATQQLQVAATPAPAGNMRAPSAAVTPATAPGAVLSGAGAVLQRSTSMQSSAAGRAAQTPRVLAGLPSLSALLAAASGPGGGSPAAAAHDPAAAGTDPMYLLAAAAGGEGDTAGDQAAMLDCSLDEEQCAAADAMAIDDLLQEDAEPQATGAAGDPGTLLHEVSPKESDVTGGQHSLPPAALATPAPQVIEALPGAAAASTAAAKLAAMAADTNSRDLQRISPLSTSSDSSAAAAAGNSGAPAAQHQQEADKLSSPSNTPETAATAAAGEPLKASTPAATLPGTSGTSNTTSSGGGRASGGSSGGSSAGGGGGRALSVISLKKLWRESHAAAMAAAAAAAAANDTANTSSDAAAAEGAASESPAAAAAEPSERLEAIAAKEASMEPQAATEKGDRCSAAAVATQATECLRERSPDTLAIARCADLLLLAAAAEEADGAAAAAAAASTADDANKADGTPPADRPAEDDGRLAEAAATLAAAAAAVEAPAATTASAAPQGLKVAAARARRSTNPQSKVAAARVAVSAVMPRQPHAVHAAALQRRHHLDTMPLPTVRPHVPPAPSAAAVVSGAAAAAAAAGGSAVCGGVSAGQLVSNCSSSLMLPPAAQMRLHQLQQQQGVGSAAAPVGLSRFHPVPAAYARVPHVQTPGQMPPPRTSHTGVYLQSPRQLNPVAPESLNPAGGLQASCWTTGGPEQQQQQAGCGAAAAEVGSAGVSGAAAAAATNAEAAAARPAAAAASGAARALSSLCGGSALGSSCRPAADAVRLDIAPLHVPPLLSDAECWRLARSQPWLIEAVAAGARQLLSGNTAAGPAAAATTTGGMTAATGHVGALGNKAGATMGRIGKAAGSVAGAAAKQDSSHMMGAAAAGSWGGYKCSGVHGPAVAGAGRAAAPPQKQQQRQAFGARVLQERNC